MLSLNQRLLLKIQTIYYFALGLGNIFLQIFIFKLSGFSTVVVFNFFVFLLLLLTYILSGWILNKRTSQFVLRLGLLIISFFWGLLFILQEKALDYIISLGLLMGIGAGLYWSGFNLSQYIETNKADRNVYFGKGFAFINIVNALGPFIAGSIIYLCLEYTSFPLLGYSIVFAIVLTAILITAKLSEKLDIHSGIVFKLSDITAHKRSNHWKLILYQQVLLGLYDAAIAVFIGIIFYVIFTTELQTGITQSIMVFLTALVSYRAALIIKKYNKIYLLSSMIYGIGLISLSFFYDKLGIFIVVLCTVIAAPFINIALSSAFLNTIDEDKRHWRKKYHYLIERDASLGTARIISFITLFLLFTLFEKEMVARYWLILVSPLPMIACFLLYKMQSD